MGARTQALISSPRGILVRGGPVNYLGRLGGTGALDPKFIDQNAIKFDQRTPLLVQLDEKILQDFNKTPSSGGQGHFLVRSLADGHDDSSFPHQMAFPGVNAKIGAAIPLPDGKFLIGGSRVRRFHADGSEDTSFSAPDVGVVLSLAYQSEGRVLVGASGGGHAQSTRLLRLQSTGVVDSSFSPTVNGFVEDIVIQPDGKILVAGSFTKIAGVDRSGLARLNGNGTVDTAFAPVLTNDEESYTYSNGTYMNNVVATPEVYVMRLALQSDGKVIAFGSFDKVSGVAAGNIARINPDGSSDGGFSAFVNMAPGAAFKSNESLPFLNYHEGGLALQADGKILIGGQFIRVNGANRSLLARLNNVTATQSLSIGDGSQITWSRGGSCPEVLNAQFEFSRDGGATWTMLGQGSRIGVTSNWQLAGVNLRGAGQLRARGQTHRGGLTEYAQAYVNATPEPEIEVMATAVITHGSGVVDFGKIAPGGYATSRIAIMNKGSAALTLSQPIIEGINAGDFSITLGQPNLGPLTQGQEAVMFITFRPGAAGERTARIRIPNNDWDEGNFEFGLVGGGIPGVPEIEVQDVNGITSGVALTSGVSSFELGGRSPIPFKILNRGNGPLNISSIIIEGGSPNEYILQTEETDMVIAPGMSSTFNVIAYYQEFGPQSAVLRIFSDDSDESPFSITLTGNHSASTAANLHSLSLIGEVLSFTPEVNADTTEYTAQVSNWITSIVVSATGSPGSVTRINGQVLQPGATSTASLNVGANVLPIRVTAEDGVSYRDYSLTITRSGAASGGGVDLGHASGLPSNHGTVGMMTLQPDGKLLVARDDATQARRLNSDGSLDSSFSLSVGDGYLRAMAVEADGNILMGGDFTTVNGTPRRFLARVSKTGALDSSFVPEVERVTKIRILPDRRILLGTLNSGAVLLNANGSRIAGFAENFISVYDLARQPDGKVVVCAYSLDHGNCIARLNANGSLDPTFAIASLDQPSTSMVLQPDGKVLLGGPFVTVNGATRRGVVRLESDGSIDSGFTSPMDSTDFWYVRNLALQIDGQILVAGSFGRVAGQVRNDLVRLNSDGSLESTNTFDAGTAAGAMAANALVIQPDGKILVGGSFISFNGTPRNYVVRLNNTAGAQDVDVPHFLAAFWNRGGAGPELSDVTFETSSDGGNSWTLFNDSGLWPVRAAKPGHWKSVEQQYPNIVLPLSGKVRARGWLAGGGGMIEQVRDYVANIIPPGLLGTGGAWPSSHSAQIEDTVLHFGGAPLQEFGAVISRMDVNSNPMIGGPGVTKAVSGGLYGFNGRFFSANPTLKPATTYVYRTYAINSAGITYTNARTLTTLTANPTVVTGAATVSDPTSVLLQAVVTANGEPTTASFSYGLTQSYGATITAAQGTINGNQDTYVSAMLTGLKARTTYHFRANAANARGPALGGAGTFTTGNSLPTAPDGMTAGITGDQKTITLEFPLEDADGDAVRIKAANSGTGVTVDAFSDTTVSFTPDPTFTGEGHFTYTVTDGFGGEATGTIVVTITGKPAVISFGAAAYSADQEADSVELTILRTNGLLASEVTIHTVDGTPSKAPPFAAAVAGKDYSPLNGQARLIEFAPGELVKKVTIQIAPKTASNLPNRRFSATLSSPTQGSQLGALATTEIRILSTDNESPRLTILTPSGANVSSTSPLEVRGTVEDSKGIERVEVSLNGAAPVRATLDTATASATKTPWVLTIEPRMGANTLTVIAYDLSGNMAGVSRRFVFERRFVVGVHCSGPAGVAANLAGTAAVAVTPAAAATRLGSTTSPLTFSVRPGSTVKVTATHKKDHVFSHWDGAPAGATALGNVISFTMPEDDVPDLTAHFVANPFAAPAGAGNVFHGLIHAAEGTVSSNATTGYITGTIVPATGSFSGKILIDGLTQSFASVFYGNGQAFFTVGATKQSARAFGGRTLELTLSEGVIHATLTQSAGVSTGMAYRTLYTTANKARPALLNAATSGYYTLSLPAKEQTPPMDRGAYPQGDGYATVSLSNLGAVTFTAVLADGSTATGSSALVTGDTSPIFVQLPTPGGPASIKGGSFGGVLNFDPALANSDVSGSNFLWFRPAVTQLAGSTAAAFATQLYTAGWPGGVRLDAVGAFYDKTKTVQQSLGLPAPDSHQGNAQLVITDGKLSEAIVKTKFNITNNSTTKIPANDTSYSLAPTAASGLFTGTFAPNWTNPNTAKPTFKGIIVQKGASKGGYGFFLGNAKNDTDPESGGVSLGGQE